MSKPVLLSSQSTLLDFDLLAVHAFDVHPKKLFVNTIISIFFEKKLIVRESSNDLGEEPSR